MTRVFNWFNRFTFAAKVITIYILLGFFICFTFFNVSDFLPVNNNYLLRNLYFLATFAILFSSLIIYFLLRYEGVKKELANNKLKNIEKRYNILFNASSVVKILINTQDYVILDSNEAANSFLGIRKREDKTNDFKDLFRNIDEFNLVKSYIESHPASGSIVIKFSYLKNEEKYLEIFLDFVESQGSSLVYLTIYDITEKHNLEKQNEEYKRNLENLVRDRTSDLRKTNLLLERENRRIAVAEQRLANQLVFFQTIMETIPIPVFIKDLDGKLLECNKAFCDYVYLKKEEIIGNTSFDIVPEEVARQTVQFDQVIIENPRDIRIEKDYTDIKGTQHYIQYLKSPLFRADGTINGILGIINDITEYKQLQNDIKKALEKEQEISNLKSRFISMASHEFRTPLTTILASADLLEMFGRNWSQEKYNEHTSKIRRTVKNMVDLLDDVLIISRAETGKTGFNPANINLFNFCCEVVDGARTNLSDKQNIVFDYSDDRKIIAADSKLLGHILNNLLGNAVKYSPEGGDILFKVSFNYDKKEVHFSIKDEGIGISSEHQKILFEPFQRGENIGKIPGTGLGLSIVKRSVDLHNGIITCNSIIGEGTEFEIIIPLQE